MAIQIDEKHLSVEARRALSNAKSKSQLLRDALEFYVSKNGGMSEIKSDVNNEMVNDVKEIKKMLLEISQNKIPLVHEESSIGIVDVEKVFVNKEEPIKEEIQTREKIKIEEVEQKELIEVKESIESETEKINSKDEVTYKNKYKDKYSVIPKCYEDI